MFPSSFWKLVHILWPIMKRDTAGSEWQGSAWNGVITASQRLSMGLRYFAGGRTPRNHSTLYFVQ